MQGAAHAPEPQRHGRPAIDQARRHGGLAGAPAGRGGGAPTPPGSRSAMAVLLSPKPAARGAWRAALLAEDPGLDIRMFPDAGDPAAIEAAVVWTSHDMAELRRYPNLRLIVSMGAGVDHLLRPPGPPPGVPVARLKDARLTQGMTEWVVLNVLRFHRQDLEYRALQAERRWEELPAPETASRRVGILGMGELGGAAAAALLALGFPV